MYSMCVFLKSGASVSPMWMGVTGCEQRRGGSIFCPAILRLTYDKVEAHEFVYEVPRRKTSMLL